MFKELRDLYQGLNTDRQKRQEEFRAFHKELIEEFGPTLGAGIGGFAHGKLIATGLKKANNYGIELTVKDLIWWDDEFEKNPTIVMRPINEIKRIIYAEIVMALESLSAKMGDDEAHKRVLELYEKFRTEGIND